MPCNYVNIKNSYFNNKILINSHNRNLTQPLIDQLKVFTAQYSDLSVTQLLGYLLSRENPRSRIGRIGETILENKTGDQENNSDDCNDDAFMMMMMLMMTT